MNRFLILTLVMLTAVPFAIAQDVLPDPEKPGPYPVGVTTVMFVDHSRMDDYAGGPRTLMTEIWYPATDASAALPTNRLLDFYLKGTHKGLIAGMTLAFKANIVELDATYQNFAKRDAQVRDGVFPLVLFSHGNGGMRSQNAFYCEHVASHGYIVVAPDHTGNCAVTTIDGKLIVYNNEGRDQAAKDRPLDMSFLIDQMDRYNKGADSRFLGKIDLDRIAMSGHSFGGYTSAWVADTDDRVDCIIPMAGISKEWTTTDTPTLILMATEDDTIGLEGNERIRTYYDEVSAEKYFVEFVNGGHYSFTEMFQFVPDFGDGVGVGERITNGEPITYLGMEDCFRLTNGYATAFLGKMLKGLDGYTDYLTTNQLEVELIVKHNVPKPAVTE